jgi:hypothetical protein
MLEQAAGNKALDVRIPLIDISLKKIISYGTVFTDAFYEFFVKVEDFNDRAIKSLVINGGEITSITESAVFELYVMKSDPMVNPIPEKADQLRSQALKEDGVCRLEIPAYSGTSSEFINSIIGNVTGCGIVVCPSEGCERCSDDTCVLCEGGDCDGEAGVEEYRGCDCDVVVTVDGENKLKLFSVYSKADGSINDIKMMGIFEELHPDKSVSEAFFYEIPINTPQVPPVVPRFNTLSELTARMSQVVTKFTGIPTEIYAVYQSRSSSIDGTGKFMFGIQFQKGFTAGVSFDSSLTLGDFATLAVKESGLRVDGSFSLTTEFGVLLGADPAESLKIVSQINETNCTGDNFVFNISLHRSKVSLNKTVSLNNCSDDGIVARKNSLQTAVEAAFNDNNDATESDDISVTLVGEDATLVLAFHNSWSSVVISVPPEHTWNVYGITNGTKKKGGLQFAVGLIELEANLDLSGSATASATLLDSVEAEASVNADVSGYMKFGTGTKGRLLPTDEWASKIKSVLTPTDEFYDPDFARASLTMDGRFRASVELKKPFEIELPLSVKGGFKKPFELSLLNTTAIGSTRPNLEMKVDLPNVSLSSDIPNDILSVSSNVLLYPSTDW